MPKLVIWHKSSNNQAIQHEASLSFFLFCSLLKRIDSLLSWVCPVIDYKIDVKMWWERQWNSHFLFLIHFGVICDQWTDARQRGILSILFFQSLCITHGFTLVDKVNYLKYKLSISQSLESWNRCTYTTCTWLPLLIGQVFSQVWCGPYFKVRLLWTTNVFMVTK